MVKYSKTTELKKQLFCCVLGNYPLTYTVTDSSGNQSTTVRIVKVCDLEAPVITVEDTIQIRLGELLPEITASDTIDGDILVEPSGDVNYCKVGEYVLELIAEDSAGNISSQDIFLEILPLVSETAEGLRVEFTEFSTDIEDYSWMENAVLVIYFDMYNDSDHSIELSPNFWWINDSFENLEHFNSYTAFAHKKKTLAPASEYNEYYLVSYERDSQEFFSSTEMHYDPTKYIWNTDFLFKYEICFQDLFDASTVK